MTDNIKKAIENLMIRREDIYNEQLTNMAILRASRYIDFSHIDLIEKRYSDKIANIDREIDEMRVHLSALQKEATNAKRP